MAQYRTVHHDLERAGYGDNQMNTGNTLSQYLPIKKEIDTSIDDFENSIKLEPLSLCMPMKDEVDIKMHNFGYANEVDQYLNIKHEIDTGGGTIGYDIGVKVKNEPVGVENYLSNRFSRKIDEASKYHVETPGNYTTEPIIEKKAIGVEQFVSNLFSRKAEKTSNNYIKASEIRPKGNFFKCQYCDYTTTNWSHYKDHRLIHKEEVPKNKLCQCINCNKFFQENDCIVKHKGKGRSKKSKHFICFHCDGKEQLTHREEKSYNCTHCEKLFTDESKWKIHMAIHREMTESGMKPNQCSHCGKCCVSHIGLARHRRIARH